MVRLFATALVLSGFATSVGAQTLGPGTELLKDEKLRLLVLGFIQEELPRGASFQLSEVYIRSKSGAICGRVAVRDRLDRLTRARVFGIDPRGQRTVVTPDGTLPIASREDANERKSLIETATAICSE